MNELPVFISYRQIDGTELALWIRETLHGRSIMVPGRPQPYPVTLSAYFDRAAPAVADWTSLNQRALEQAQALVLLCTPGAMHDFGVDDCLYRELRWWVENRGSLAPVLVAPKHLDQRWVPGIIRERWPNAQMVHVDLRASEPGASLELSIQSILGGISTYAQAASSCVSQGWHAGEQRGDAVMLNAGGFYAWEKDRHFRYIGCNENYARAAGFDSPQAMIGKTDDEMPWRSLADFFRSGDYQVISGQGPPRVNVNEKEIMVDRVADILVTENQLLDRRGECVGLTGYFIDITGARLVPWIAPQADASGGLHLGEEFHNAYLSGIDVPVLKSMLKSRSAAQIAANLMLDIKVVEEAIRSIKRKLQCVTDGDVIATVIRSGLPRTLFGSEMA